MVIKHTKLREIKATLRRAMSKSDHLVESFLFIEVLKEHLVCILRTKLLS
jgi:hypothetical protein